LKRRIAPVKLRGVFGLILGTCGFGFAALAADLKLAAFGQHLAGECAGCHRLDGVDNGVPSITGWPTGDFVATMKFYSSGARSNPVMKSVADSLDDAQLAALAAYYGSLAPPPKKQK
jgi:cytochrome c553